MTKEQKEKFLKEGNDVGVAAATMMKEKIVEFIRDRAAEVAGKTWYHPEFQLSALAQEIEDLK